MIFGAQSSDLFADIERYRIVSIVGYRGVGKDLLATELSVRFLDRGYRFWSNQLHVWNDPLWCDWDEWKSYNPRISSLVDSGLGSYPNVRKFAVVLSEAGRYLRRYEYFEDMFEFSRKLDTYYFFPSVRPPHEDLQCLLIYPSLLQFSRFFSFFSGGLWNYKVQDGLNAEKIGKFWFFPSKKYIGVYDTEDPTSTTEEYLSVIRLQIELEQNARNRDGLQSLDAHFLGDDAESLRTHQARIFQANQALLSKISKSKR